MTPSYHLVAALWWGGGFAEAGHARAGQGRKPPVAVATPSSHISKDCEAFRACWVIIAAHAWLTVQRDLSHFDSHSNSSRKVGIMVLILKRRKLRLRKFKCCFYAGRLNSNVTYHCSCPPWWDTDLQFLNSRQWRKQTRASDLYHFANWRLLNFQVLFLKHCFKNVENLKAQRSFVSTAVCSLEPGQDTGQGSAALSLPSQCRVCCAAGERKQW